MRYLEVPPCPALLPYVTCLWAQVSPMPLLSRYEHPVLPDNCIDLIFEYGDRRRGKPPGFVVGMMSRPLVVSLEGNVDFVAVRFRAAGASPFFGLPLSSLVDSAVDLQDLWGSDLARLEDRLAATSDLRARFELLERALLERLSRPLAPGPSPLVREALRLADRSPQRSIETVASLLGVSRQHLARQFDRSVGLSPKRYFRSARFRRMLDAVESQPEIDWSATALDFGYYDQAHLIAEFQALAGKSPERWLGQ
jgi:AraC-like DNA-binding protein